MVFTLESVTHSRIDGAHEMVGTSLMGHAPAGLLADEELEEVHGLRER